MKIPKSTTERSMFNCNVLTYVILFCSIYTYGQNYPEELNLNSVSYDSYSAPSSNRPQYLESFTESLSGNTVTRISDAQELGVTNQRLRHNYAKDQTWNADGTLIKLAEYPAAILDGETYEFLYWATIPSYGRWSNIDPLKLFGVQGNAFVSMNVESGQRTVLRTFSQYTKINFGYGEGNMSNDDRYVGLIGINGSSRVLFVYDVLNDAVTGEVEIGTSGDLDWFSVSQLGQYAIAQYRTDGSGVSQGTKVYDINMTNPRHIYNYTAHGDLGVDAYGNEVLVEYGNQPQWGSQHSLVMVRLDGGGVTNLFPYVNGRGIWGGHVSCRNTGRPGWAYVSETCCSGSSATPREIFAIKLDNSGTIERYAKHHTNTQSGYGHQAQAVPSQDGTKVMFASNWNNMFTGSHSPSWIVEVPQNSLSTESFNTNADAISVYPNPSQGQFNVKVASNTIESVSVNDMLGRVVYAQTFDNPNTNTAVNLSKLPSGMYILNTALNNDKTISKRIVIQ